MRDCEINRLEEGDSTTSMACLSSSSWASRNGENYGLKSHPIQVEVEAPATLSEGYVFWATTTTSSCKEDEDCHRSCDSPLNHQSVTFPVTVPSGGVSEGETMRVPLLTHSQSEDHDSFDVEDSDTTSLDAEHLEKHDNRGQWKSGICSCLERGIFHPDPWSAWLCPQILLGQILMRTNLVSLAQPTASCQRKDSSKLSKCLLWIFRILLCIGIAAYLNFTLYQTEVLTLSHAMDPSRTLEVFWWQELVSLVLTLPMSIWALSVVVRLRRTIRERYEIPSGSLGNSEDLVCALCCGCCVLSQMAHQTNDWDELNSTTSEKQNDETANNNKRFFGWFRKQAKITPSRPLVTTTHPSPSNSIASDNSHLRYRLLSSPSS